MNYNNELIEPIQFEMFFFYNLNLKRNKHDIMACD